MASILVIYAGGTLGMVPGARGLQPGGDFEPRLRQAVTRLPPARQASLPDFAMLEYAHPIDSSSAMPSDWQVLARDIASRYDAYAGFVVLQGTDTLAWTASSLAFQLQGTGKPVIITGAQKPLEADASDALANIEAALRFATRPELQEVAVCFGGKLLRGCRTRKWETQAFEAFVSPNCPLLGEIVDHDAILYASRGLERQRRGAPRFELPDLAALPASPVVRIALWPGITARQIENWLQDAQVNGALLEVWGSGNLPDDPALLGVLAEASGAGKLIAAISQCPRGPMAAGTYAAGQGLVAAGVLSGDTMTPEAAMTKLIHLLAQPSGAEDRRERFLTSLAGER
ncbi:asparaginase [Halomonas shantousis]